MIKKKLDIILRKRKSIRFSEFMNILLFDNDHGVYEKDNLFGDSGHFITAPLASKYFSWCIARNYEDVSKVTPSVDIVEFGAGSAVLAADLIKYLSVKSKLPKKYFIFEKSKNLIKAQRSLLEENNIMDIIDVVWITDFKELPSSAFIICNEFFDCIPTDLVKYDNNEFHIAHIDNNYQLIWEKYLFKEEGLCRFLNIPEQLPDNYIFEFSKEQSIIVNKISENIDRGYFLIFDYGYSSNELYLKERNMGTITCIKNHIYDFNPLDDLGNKDISSFVNFSYLDKLLKNNNWITLGFMSQCNYLLSQGILEDADSNNISEMAAIKKLIMPNQMGEIFKVLVLKKNIEDMTENKFLRNDLSKL